MVVRREDARAKAVADAHETMKRVFTGVDRETGRWTHASCTSSRRARFAYSLILPSLILLITLLNLYPPHPGSAVLVSVQNQNDDARPRPRRLRRR